jgi:hypothetical protein
VTPKSVREYLAAQRTRYALGSRAERTRLLDEITAVSRYHRKAIIRHLRGDGRRPPGRRPVGRPRRYGAAVAEVAAVVWEAAGQIGAQRLHPFVRELLGRLMAFGEVHATPATAALLGQASLATLERLLAPARAHRPRRGAGATRPGTWLKHQIPIRTFAEWDDAEPGFLEVDLVAHCGATAGAFFLYTLCAVDVATSWVELEALWGKNLTRVQGAVHEIRRRLPMPLRGLDTDNGSEFINRPLLYSCYRTGLTFTRSRAYHKNDSAQVEQKNGAIVRALIGHDRFASKTRLRPIRAGLSRAPLAHQLLPAGATSPRQDPPRGDPASRLRSGANALPTPLCQWHPVRRPPARPGGALLVLEPTSAPEGDRCRAYRAMAAGGP